MSTIFIAHKGESSERDLPRKYEQTQNLMLICSDMLKKAISENVKIFIPFVDLNDRNGSTADANQLNFGCEFNKGGFLMIRKHLS